MGALTQIQPARPLVRGPDNEPPREQCHSLGCVRRGDVIMDGRLLCAIHGLERLNLQRNHGHA